MGSKASKKTQARGTMFHRILRGLAAAIVLGGLLFAAPANAAPPAPVATSSTSTSSTGIPSLLSRQARSDAELREQIALQMEIAPGGKQTSLNEVSYDNGKFVVTYALPGQRALGVADCPANWFCFYQDSNFGYPRGKLSDCYTQELAQYGWANRISSVDNSTFNSVEYWERLNPTTTLYLFTNYNPGALASLGDYNDRADVVHRNC
ncbi:peptidase inhibitor family I36 protein [Herbidospora cretacea]|uniref:peptidase inhibitor family I36 protein n=1 Tax=Herbidospora cretacea TaxID=28444 RepID=UPI0012DDAB95|nr:peptidase inhibitor family I36 protein [Herbidospora cretacea]